MASLYDRFGAVSDAISTGEFDPVGANSTTFNYGTGSGDIPALPALPSIGSTFAPSATSKGNVVTSTGGASGTSGVAPTLGNVTPGTGGTPSNAVAGPAATPSQGAGPVSGSIADYFARGVIIILGFIFVAVGLNMFKPGIVPDPRKIVR